jgi:hypothetical protein
VIVATMATLSSREHMLGPTVASLIDQVDCLLVYCNGHRRVPACLLHPKIAHSVLSLEHGIRGAEAKLMFWDRSEWKAAPYFTDDTIALTVDDDIQYPADYVRRHVEAIEKRPNAISCVHASILRPGFARWSTDRARIMCREPLAADSRVHVPGTGTMAFRAGALDVSLRRDVRWSHCVDVMIAIAAKAQGVEVWALGRGRDWLYPRRAPAEGTGIYRQRTGAGNDEHESRALLDAGPWPELAVPWR